MERIRRTAGVAIMALAIMMIAGSAFASAASQYKKQLEAFRAVVKEQAASDTAGMAADDLGKVITWLDEAEGFLAKGDTDAAGFRLKRAEYGLDLTGALVEASRIKGAAEQQEQAYAQTQAEIKKLKAEVDQLQLKKAELERQIQATR